MAALIELRKVTKEYRGVPAIKDVDFELRTGEIHSLVGENGAGKSTLTNIIAGVTEPSAGVMLFEGREVAFHSPAEALASGINMVFQENSLVPSMSVAQNIFLGDEKFFNRIRGIYIAAQQLMGTLNFPVDPWATVATLGAAKKQMVEIARAVRKKARGISIIFISHALEEALEASDRITILRDGELVITDATSTFDREKIIRAMVGRNLS